jgi:hypothetical protein
VRAWNLCSSRTGQAALSSIGSILAPAGFKYSPVPTDYSNWQDSFGIVKVGVNYKFGGPVVVKY